MYKPKIRPPESEEAPLNYGVIPSTDRKSSQVLPVEPPVYPAVDTFDIDNLSRLGITPQTAPPIINDTIESFENSINLIDDNTLEA